MGLNNMDYILDYGLGAFILFDVHTKKEVEISEEEAIEIFDGSSVKGFATMDAKGMIETIKEVKKEELNVV